MKLVKFFIASSKSDLRMMDFRPSRIAALVACKMSNVPSKWLFDPRSGSPNNINTSHTRSCAANGIE
jgi:hypothetical protein